MDTEKEIAVEAQAETTETTENTPAAPAAPAQQTRTPYRSQNQNHKRKKVCQFCVDKVTMIDYKDAGKLRKFTSERAKILPRRVTGTCAYHQRELTTCIKRARHLALLPYTAE